jgi:hypothetical protein
MFENENIYTLYEHLFINDDRMLDGIDAIRDCFRDALTNEGLSKDERLRDCRWMTLQLLIYCYTYIDLKGQTQQFLSHFKHLTREPSAEELEKLKDSLKSDP